jgi:hypothetical protein
VLRWTPLLEEAPPFWIVIVSGQGGEEALGERKEVFLFALRSIDWWIAYFDGQHCGN